MQRCFTGAQEEKYSKCLIMGPHVGPLKETCGFSGPIKRDLWPGDHSVSSAAAATAAVAHTHTPKASHPKAIRKQRHRSVSDVVFSPLL